MIFHYTIRFITLHVAILKYFNLNEMSRLQRISIMLNNKYFLFLIFKPIAHNFSKYLSQILSKHETLVTEERVALQKTILTSGENVL